MEYEEAELSVAMIIAGVDAAEWNTIPDEFRCQYRDQAAKILEMLNDNHLLTNVA